MLERLGAVDPGARDLEYFRGLASYRRKDWAAARVDLEAALAGRSDDAVLRLLLGVTNAELGEVVAAREHFEAAKREPTLVGQASYRLGVLAVRENEFDDAREHFTAVGRSPGVPVHSELANSAAEYLSRLDERGFRRWDLNVTLGAGYDSNVTLTDDSSLTSGTSAGLGVVELGGSYRLFDEGRFSVRVSQSGYFNFHTTLTDFDLQISESSLAARARLADWAVADLRYTFQFAAADWDSFRSTHAVEPAFVLSSAWNIQARPYFRYERRDYDDIGMLGELLDRDGNVYTPGVDLFYTLPWFPEWGSSWVRLGYRFRKESADSDEFDSEGHEPIVALGLALPRDFFLSLEGRYEWREYDSPSLFDDPGSSDQSDRIRVFRSSISRRFGKHMSAEIFYRYTDRGSNVKVYRYRRNEVQLRFTYHL